MRLPFNFGAYIVIRRFVVLSAVFLLAPWQIVVRDEAGTFQATLTVNPGDTAKDVRAQLETHHGVNFSPRHDPVELRDHAPGHTVTELRRYVHRHSAQQTYDLSNSATMVAANIRDGSIVRLMDQHYWTCFVAGTPMRMADGTDLPIEKIKVGMKVQSWDVLRAQPVKGVVTETMAFPAAEVVTVTAGGSQVTCTPGKCNCLGNALNCAVHHHRPHRAASEPVAAAPAPSMLTLHVLTGVHSRTCQC